MKKLAGLAVPGVTLALALTLAGCAGQGTPSTQGEPASKPAESQKVAEGASLSDWEGSWNGLNHYLDDEGLSDAYEEVAKRDGTTAEAVKNEMKEKVSAEFSGLEVSGDTISFLDGFKDKGGKEVAKTTYKFVEARKVKHGGAELEWDVFKAVEPDAKYPVLLMMPVHGEEELVHFHLRYGSDVDELMKRDDWYPTFVKPNTTLDQIKGEIKE